MAKLFDIMGKFPFPPEEKKPRLIHKWEYSTALYPPNDATTSDNTFTLVSTDTFMLGIYELGPGGVFAPLDIPSLISDKKISRFRNSTLFSCHSFPLPQPSSNRRLIFEKSIFSKSQLNQPCLLVEYFSCNKIRSFKFFAFLYCSIIVVSSLDNCTKERIIFHDKSSD